MTKFCVIVVCLGLAACTNNKKDQEGVTPVATPPAPTAPSPAASGSAGGSAVPAGTLGAEAAKAGPAGGATTPSPEACASTSKLTCEASQVDGCTGGLTSVHACVARDAKAGTPCAQGAALTCPTGQIDACTYVPPYASNHICVVVPKPAP